MLRERDQWPAFSLPQEVLRNPVAQSAEGALRNGFPDRAGHRVENQILPGPRVNTCLLQ